MRQSTGIFSLLFRWCRNTAIPRQKDTSSKGLTRCKVTNLQAVKIRVVSVSVVLKKASVGAVPDTNKE